jgi:capping protein alpha
MASEEEIVSIANNFLLSSPPGEFLEVAIDVRALLRDDSVLNASAPDTFREYNQEQMLQAKSPGHEHEVLICKFGEVGPGEYVDHRGRQVVIFDHIKQEVTGQRPLSQHDYVAELESQRSALEELAAGYAADHYPYGSACAYASREGGSQLILAISAARFQGANFVNGRWRSTWVCTLDRASVKLSGTIKLHVHYYEDGNVQLVTDTTKQITLPNVPQSPQGIADAIIKAVAKAEADFQTALDAMYTTMSENTFKAIRRVLPVTRNKIDWEKILKYRLGMEAGSAASGQKK